MNLSSGRGDEFTQPLLDKYALYSTCWPYLRSLLSEMHESVPAPVPAAAGGGSSGAAVGGGAAVAVLAGPHLSLHPSINTFPQVLHTD